MTTERDIFEHWYARVAAAEAGLNITAEQLKAMRQDDHYGAQRIALNSKWEAWQACADRYGRVGEPGTAEKPELDLYDPLVQQGIQWTLRQVGERLGASSWTAGDGTETVEGDVWNELDSICANAGYASVDAVLDAVAAYLKVQYGASYGMDHPLDRFRVRALLAGEAGTD